MPRTNRAYGAGTEVSMHTVHHVQFSASLQRYTTVGLSTTCQGPPYATPSTHPAYGGGTQKCSRLYLVLSWGVVLPGSQQQSSRDRRGTAPTTDTTTKCSGCYTKSIRSAVQCTVLTPQLCGTKRLYQIGKTVRKVLGHHATLVQIPIALRTRYGVFCTELTHGTTTAICLRCCLYDWYNRSLAPYATPTDCFVLTWRMGYQKVLRGREAGGRALYLSHVRYCLSVWPQCWYGPIRLRVCYAMSGGRIASGAICLRACYAMYGTEIGYAATRRVLCHVRLCCYQEVEATRSSPRRNRSSPLCPKLWAYAISGTVTWRMVLSPYTLAMAMSGTDSAYGATRKGRKSVSGAELLQGDLRYLPTRLLCDARYRLLGRPIQTPHRYQPRSTVGYRPTRMLCDARDWHNVYARAIMMYCLVLSPYDHAMQCPVLLSASLVRQYGMSGTEVLFKVISLLCDARD
eukprot:1703817-Rhodomonas_salina.2